MYDLPSGNQDEQPDDFHFLQTLLLYLTFIPTTCSGKLAYSACNLNLYYDLNHPEWYKRPDWFGVVGVHRLYQGRDLRLSYLIWQEIVSPCVVGDNESGTTQGTVSGINNRLNLIKGKGYGFINMEKFRLRSLLSWCF